jgi:uncharacterized protein YndB with AHSA1/START domain
MRIEQTFTVDKPPEVVFDWMTDPANLASWQNTKVSVEQLTPGPPGQGTRIRERTKPPMTKAFDQVVEFTGFERPRLLETHIVEGPHPVDGRWTFEPDDGGTRVHFEAWGEMRGAMRFLGPLVPKMVGRQFAHYHELLRKHVEAAR